jgi:hypothetical protein
MCNSFTILDPTVHTLIVLSIIAGKPNKMLWQVEINGLQEIYRVISNFVSSNLKVSIVHSQIYFSLR